MWSARFLQFLCAAMMIFHSVNAALHGFEGHLFSLLFSSGFTIWFAWLYHSMEATAMLHRVRRNLHVMDHY